MNHADQLQLQARGLNAWPGREFCADASQHEAALAPNLSQQKDALHQLHADLLERLHRQYISLDQQKEDRRQAALGALVAGVAHQLNTPVGTSLTVASSLEHRLNEFTKLLEAGLRRSDVQHSIEDTRLAVDLLLRNWTVLAHS